MKFEIKEQGTEPNRIEDHSIDTVKLDLQNRFALDDSVAIYQELRMVDGRIALSLRDRSNKVIIQYKTIEPL